MKTDRELLGLAAKAAGVNLQWMGGPVELRDGIITAWNPLAYDSDALRLAVTLGLGISIPLKAERTDVITFDGPVVSVIEKHGDPGVATRRAIVRAAAKIGEQQ